MTDKVETKLTVDGADAVQELHRVGKAEEDHARAVKATGEAAEQANRKSQVREQSNRGLRVSLDRLTREQVQHEQSVQQGARADEQAVAQSERRQRIIQRLSQRLARQEDLQDEVNRRVRESVGVHRAAATAAEEHGREVEDASDQVESLTDRHGVLENKITGVVSAAGAIGIARTGYQEWLQDIETINQKLKEQAELVRAGAEARLDLVALRGVEDPELVRSLDQAATIAGRSPGEVYRVAAIVESQFPNATDEEKSALVQEIAIRGQATSAPLQSLAGPISGIFRALQADGTENPALVAGNLFDEAVSQAGQVDPALLGRSIGGFLQIGRSVGGLDTAESVGYASAATGMGLQDEVAITGLRNVMLAIRGRGTPEGREVLASLGIEAGGGADVEEALRTISSAAQSGSLGPAELESLVGKEALSTFTTLIEPRMLADFFAKVNAVEAQETRSDRIVTERVEGFAEPGSIQAFNLLSKQAESEGEGIRGRSVIAAEQDSVRRIVDVVLEERLAAGEITEELAERIRTELDEQLAAGASLERALFQASTRQNTDFGIRLPLGWLGGEGSQFISLSAGSLAEIVMDTDGNPTLERNQRDFLIDPVLDRLGSGPQFEPSDQPDEYLGQLNGRGVYRGSVNIYNGPVINTGDPDTDDLGRRGAR